MLRGIRQASTNWLGKIIMGVVVAFLVVSFAIWGVGDMFRGYGLSTVATIGNTEISIDRFRQIYNERLQQLSRQLGRPITPEQARALGLDQQILGQMIAEAALDERARQLGLSVTDEEIARQITSEPAFHGPNGRFSRPQFEQMIRDAGYTETRFVNEQRRTTIRRQLAQTISGDIPTTLAVLEAANRFQNEQRTVEYVVLDRAQAGAVTEPSPEELARYFDEHRVEFRAPEYRQLDILVLSPEEIGRWMTIPDADLRRFYEANRARYGVPERRHVRQIVFPSAEEAMAAAERIAKGTPFEAVAAERNLTPQDIDLGIVPRAGIVDPAVADAAFKLLPKEVSAPVKGRFGVALVQTLAIEPERVRSFEDAAADIRKEIAADRARDQMHNLRDKIEDERAAGATLAEVGKKLGLITSKFEVDRSGRAADGTQVEVPGGAELLNSAFLTDVGVEADPVPLGAGGLAYFDVLSITPSRERTLDEVRERVTARWRDERISQQLRVRAAGILERVKAGTGLEEVARSEGLKVERATGLTRVRPTEAFPAGVLATVFRTPKDTVASAEGQPPQQIVFRVTDVSAPALKEQSPEMAKLSESLRGSVAETMLAEYLTHVQREIGARINPVALRQATGAAVEQ